MTKTKLLATKKKLTVCQLHGHKIETIGTKTQSNSIPYLKIKVQKYLQLNSRIVNKDTRQNIYGS